MLVFLEGDICIMGLVIQVIYHGVRLSHTCVKDASTATINYNV